MPGARRVLSHLAASDAADLRDARAASDQKSLAERTTDAFEWLAVSVAEIARIASGPADLRARLEGEAPVALVDARTRKRALRGS